MIRILRDASQRAVDLLTANREKLDLLARKLEKEETLDEHAIEELLGPRPSRKDAEPGETVRP